MKIALINSVYNVGSTGRIVKCLYDNLIANNHDVKVFYGRNNQLISDDNIKFIGSRRNLINDVAMSLVFDKHGENSKKSTVELIKQLDKFQPDIINIHNIHGFYVNLPILLDYCKKSKSKIALTLHDEWLFTGFCGLYTTNNCNKWKLGCNDCKIRTVYPYRIGVKNTHQKWQDKKQLFDGFNNLTIITPSKWLAEDVKQSFLRQYPIEIINNGIDLDKFNNSELKDSNIVLAVSNVWSKSKGIDEYVKLANILPNNYKIVMVGVNEMQKKKLPQNIECVKRTKSIEELVGWYSKAHCLCNLSLDENFPTVDIEALACGLPIVSYDVGGGLEIIGECGMLAPKFDVEKIKSHILNINKSEEATIKCINRATEYFSDKVMVRKYIKLFDKLL